jgi:uncharacterized protein
MMAALRSLLLGLAAVAAILLGSAAPAATVADLYETAQPVETTREAAFADALKAVLVRVSGQRDAAARVGSAVGEPRKYVQRFGFTKEGMLEVGFDSVSIDRLLTDSGLPVWGRERPTTLILLGVEEADGSTRWIGSEGPGAEREVIARAARQRGLPIRWPAMDSQDRISADAEETGALLQTAARYDANAVLVGHARGGSATWRLVSSEGASETAGTLEEGVHFAADIFARVFAASGGSIDNVTVDVSGISNLDAYAATLNYLESMTLVKGVSLEQVARDTLRFRVAVRGDAATLKRAIALDRRLVPVDGDAGAEAAAPNRLSFRFQP